MTIICMDFILAVLRILGAAMAPTSTLRQTRLLCVQLILFLHATLYSNSCKAISEMNSQCLRSSGALAECELDLSFASAMT
jgi:hypothetical protein